MERNTINVIIFGLVISALVVFVLLATFLTRGKEDVFEVGADEKREERCEVSDAGCALRWELVREYPSWNEDALVVDVERETPGFAVATFETFERGDESRLSDVSVRALQTGVLFAKRDEGGEWRIVETSFAGYNGVCQVFEESGFPADMTPDCWDDVEYVQKETGNPGFFYRNGMTSESKDEIGVSYFSYVESNMPEHKSSFHAEDEYFVRIRKNTDSFAVGSVLFGGLENRSVPYFLAVKASGTWSVVFVGQDYPPCAVIDLYGFPGTLAPLCFEGDGDVSIREVL